MPSVPPNSALRTQHSRIGGGRFRNDRVPAISKTLPPFSRTSGLDVLDGDSAAFPGRATVVRALAGRAIPACRQPHRAVALVASKRQCPPDPDSRVGRQAPVSRRRRRETAITIACRPGRTRPRRRPLVDRAGKREWGERRPGLSHPFSPARVRRRRRGRLRAHERISAVVGLIS